LRWTRSLAVVLLMAVLALLAVQALRPLPSQAVTVRPVAQGVAGLRWPADRESAVAVSGLSGVLAAGASGPVPIASLAKMMTAYVVLRDHPLAGSQPGPSITVSRADAAAYRADLAEADSVVKVRAGEALTEREALEALLLPSADNVADILAVWDAGSVGAFVVRMNAAARSLGMSRTRYADPAGLSAATVSTARDQLVITRAAMSIPAFAGIVAQPAVRLPVAGLVENFDYAVGHDGITGVKTGSDSAALGCWAFAAVRAVDGSQRTVYGVVLGVPATAQGLVEPALAAGQALASGVAAALRPMTLLRAGTVVGQVTAPWRRTAVPVITTRPITGLVSPGTRVTFRAALTALPGAGLGRGERVGFLTASGALDAGGTPLAASGAAPGPTLRWRLSRL
jgi:D-alanyl-D-alanine carboxypeptidase (penicillin-binding protein 5/6)